MIALQRRMWKLIASVNTLQTRTKLIELYSCAIIPSVRIIHTIFWLYFSWDGGSWQFVGCFFYHSSLEYAQFKYRCIKMSQQQSLFRSLISMYCRFINGTRHCVLYEHQHSYDSRRNRKLCWKWMFLLLKYLYSQFTKWWIASTECLFCSWQLNDHFIMIKNLSRIMASTWIHGNTIWEWNVPWRVLCCTRKDAYFRCHGISKMWFDWSGNFD